MVLLQGLYDKRMKVKDFYLQDPEIDYLMALYPGLNIDIVVMDTRRRLGYDTPIYRGVWLIEIALTCERHARQYKTGRHTPATLPETATIIDRTVDSDGWENITYTMPHGGRYEATTPPHNLTRKHSLLSAQFDNR